MLLLLLLLLRQVKINKAKRYYLRNGQFEIESIEILYSISKKKDIIFQRSIFNFWSLYTISRVTKGDIKLRL